MSPNRGRILYLKESVKKSQGKMSKKDKKSKEGEEEKPVVNWDGSSYFPANLIEEMKSMWEIPQIYQFLYLTKDILNVPPTTIYEMERMLAIPQASKQLANIMTCLLSGPTGKPKLQKIPPMPYQFWTNILMHKINNWFKFYDGKHGDVIKILETVGIEPEFWNIFPDSSVFADRDFEKLSFKQRVWLLKTICDTLMHTRKTIQEEISNHPWEDQIEINLGTDRNGAKYIYFPQFINSELRIYRYSMNNNVLSPTKPVIPKKTAEGSETKTKVKRKRKSKWQKGLCSKVKKKKTPSRPQEKEIDKDCYICNCFDSAMNLQISEDIDLCCTSTSSSNNISSINLENLDGKEISDPLITSEISTLSSDTSSISSNDDDDDDDDDDNDNDDGDDGDDGDDDDDNNSRLTDLSDEENPFKGFSGSSYENHCIAIINRLLSKLQSEIDVDCIETIENAIADTRCCDVENIVDKQMKDNYESLSNESDPTTVKYCLDNLSNKSKNDDEKLNDIIAIESIILNDKMFSTSSEYNNDLDSSSAFRSIDEKLNETETSITNEIESILSDVPDIINNCDIIRNSMRSPNDGEMKDTTGNDNAIDGSFLDTNETHDYVGRSPTMANENSEMEVNSLLNDISQLVNDDINRDEVENNPERVNERASFKSMLDELAVSNFRLVADSVETLRDLISSFPSNTPESNCTCEVQLVNKLTELLNAVESIETVLKDTTRKAKAKLLKEWTNFKIGTINCQLPVMQRYRRYRNLPYPQLVPKVTPPPRQQYQNVSTTRRRKNAQGEKKKITKTRAKTKKNVKSQKAMTNLREQKATNVINQKTIMNVRDRKSTNVRDRTSKTTKRKETLESNNKKTGKITKRKNMRNIKTVVEKKKNNKIEEYYEHEEYPRTSNNCIHMRRSMRASWVNGPALRPSTRLPAHRPVHPLLTLMRKTNTTSIGQRRRTQTKIGYYQALVKGKINVRPPIKD